MGERGSEAGKAQGGEPGAVTPAGIIGGDHDVLAALCERRGGAVLAYCRHISAPGLSARACAQAFARFRLGVGEATDPEALDPDATLLRATRYAAAAHVLQFVPLAPVPGLGLGRAWCYAVPQAIASRESGELSRWGRRRLAVHLRRCGTCRETEARALAAERAYQEAPVEELPAGVAAQILTALEEAVPV